MTLEDKKKVLQNNLKHIRTLLGLGVQDLADLLDVTRQTVNNLEIGKTKITRIQYYAIMFMLEREIFPKLDAETMAMIDKLLSVPVIDRKLRHEYYYTLVFEESK